MTTLLDSIPEISAEASASESGRPRASQPAKTEAVRVPTVSVHRRTFLRTAVVGGGALAVSMLGWVGARLPAYAATRTSIAPGLCLGYNTPGGDIPCWGRQYISSYYCASDGYHRTDSHNFGSTTEYYYWAAACGGYAGWTWHHPNGHGHRCTDGGFRSVVNVNGNTSWYTSLCSKYI